jgi:hypothetical protein
MPGNGILRHARVIAMFVQRDTYRYTTSAWEKQQQQQQHFDDSTYANKTYHGTSDQMPGSCPVHRYLDITS